MTAKRLQKKPRGFRSKNSDGKKKLRSPEPGAKMTAEKQTSKFPGDKKDGKKVSGNLAMDKKKPSKYTLWRSPEDVKNLEEVRKYLEEDTWKKYKTDSGIYKTLPAKYINAVKTIQELRTQIEELTAKEDQLKEISRCVCRIIEIAKKVK